MDPVPPSTRAGTAGPPQTPPADTRPRLYDVMAAKMRLVHYSIRTERSYIDWVKRFIAFHQGRHPRQMGAAEIESFLTHLAVEGRVSASTQNQAFLSAMARKHSRRSGPIGPSLRIRP